MPKTIDTKNLPPHIKQYLDWYAENHTLTLPTPVAENLIRTFYNHIQYDPKSINSPIHYRAKLYHTLPKKIYKNFGYQNIKPPALTTNPYTPGTLAEEHYRKTLKPLIKTFRKELNLLFPYPLPKNLKKEINSTEKLIQYYVKTASEKETVRYKQIIKKHTKKYVPLASATVGITATTLTPLLYFPPNIVLTTLGLTTAGMIPILTAIQRSVLKQDHEEKKIDLQVHKTRAETYLKRLKELDNLIILYKLENQYNPTSETHTVPNCTQIQKDTTLYNKPLTRTGSAH